MTTSQMELGPRSSSSTHPLPKIEYALFDMDGLLSKSPDIVAANCKTSIFDRLITFVPGFPAIQCKLMDMVDLSRKPTSRADLSLLYAASLVDRV